MVLSPILSEIIYFFALGIVLVCLTPKGNECFCFYKSTNLTLPYYTLNVTGITSIYIISGFDIAALEGNGK